MIGKIIALSRFIFKIADRCLTFFKSLHSINRFVWTEECQIAFRDLVRYLGSP